MQRSSVLLIMDRKLQETKLWRENWLRNICTGNDGQIMKQLKLAGPADPVTDYQTLLTRNQNTRTSEIVSSYISIAYIDCSLFFRLRRIRITWLYCDSHTKKWVTTDQLVGIRALTTIKWLGIDTKLFHSVQAGPLGAVSGLQPILH